MCTLFFFTLCESVSISENFSVSVHDTFCVFGCLEKQKYIYVGEYILCICIFYVSVCTLFYTNTINKPSLKQFLCVEQLHLDLGHHMGCLIIRLKSNPQNIINYIVRWTLFHVFQVPQLPYITVRQLHFTTLHLSTIFPSMVLCPKCCGLVSWFSPAQLASNNNRNKSLEGSGAYTGDCRNKAQPVTCKNYSASFSSVRHLFDIFPVTFWKLIFIRSTSSVM